MMISRRKESTTRSSIGAAQLAVAAVILGTAAPATAAPPLVAAYMVVNLVNQGVQIFKLLVSEILGKNRGAVALACVNAGCDKKTDTGRGGGWAEATATNADADGTADAHAKTSGWSSNTVQPTSGTGAYFARAQTTWKDVVELSAEGGPLPPPPALPNALAFAAFDSANALPDPADVVSATWSASWSIVIDSIGFSYASGSNGHGSLAIDLAINGIPVFSGSALANSGGASFFGDLAGYADHFSTTGGLSATDLALSGNTGGTLDYATFYADQKLLVDLSGGIEAEAAGVPEPGTWSMFIIGFAIAGGTIRRRRGASRQAELISG